MSQFPRGIAPDLLLSQVRNTMPYLFESEDGERIEKAFAPARVLREFAKTPDAELSHYEYFRLCLSSHYLTCGTPVPTDVDNQIRQKLWPQNLPLDLALEMTDLVLASHDYDFTQVSSRNVYGAKGTEFEKEALHGHFGEWFTLSSAAYCKLRLYKSDEAAKKAEAVREAIAQEVNRHSEIFGSLWRAKDGLGCLKASAYIAHNFGDLDRVMDMWELFAGDPLRLQFYKLSALPFDQDQKLRYLGRLWVAGELYKSPVAGSAMAFENHRHFALRKPKCLRQKREFLIPTGPFFDQWGATVARGLANSDGDPSDETIEVIEALKHGWERLPKSVGYGRALRGMLSVHAGIENELGLDQLKVTSARAVMDLSQERFERKWADEALVLMDDIPSRA